MRLLPVLLLAFAVHAEIRPMTFKAVLETALAQNPDLALARLDERKAAETVRAARDPFAPRAFVGSGLAYSSGFPMSMEGSAPSIVEARAIASIFNRPQRLLIEKSRQDEQTARISSEERRESVGYRAAALYVEAGRIAEAAKTVSQQIASLESLLSNVKIRIEAGRELPLEEKRARLKLAQAKQRQQRLEFDREAAETDLALLLGLAPTDRVQPLEPERSVPAIIDSETDAVTNALRNSRELQRLDSQLKAKALELRSHDAARLPTFDLVAQYGRFARFNNYDKFFNRFAANNAQVGMSFRIPLVPSLASRAQKNIASADIVALRTQVTSARGRIAVGARRAWQFVAQQQLSAEVAKLDLEVARDQVSQLLALFEEGRVPFRQLEEARIQESEKWMALFDARYALDRARLDLLRETGNVLALLR
ncbi:MAG: TolC family protein [Acidobacteriota bacterium]|jgi:outer membrane protein|nr:TolC family protein [Acidobacteriaceae bacterium]